MVRVSSVFVTKFNEALVAAGGQGEFGHRLYPMRRPEVEDFLDRIKYDSLKELMPEVVPNATISLPRDVSTQSPK